MSTANFKETLPGFPLYARQDIYSKRCPECGTFNEEGADICECCGEDISFVDDKYDAWENEILFDEVNGVMENLNAELNFYHVRVECGYYAGLQFTGEVRDPEAEELGNDDCRYYWGVCRSEAIRRFGVETRRLQKKLEAIAQEYGFEKLMVVGVFSNGEAVYRKI